MPDGNTPFTGGSGPTWNDAMMWGEARRFQANNPNYIPGPGEPDFFGRRPPPTPEELGEQAAYRRGVRWMMICPLIGIILLRTKAKTPRQALRPALWTALAFIFGCYTVFDLVRGDLIDLPVALAIAAVATWRAWRNVNRLGAKTAAHEQVVR